MGQAISDRTAFRPVSTIQVKPQWALDPDLVLYLPFWNMPDGQVFLSQDAYGHTCTRYGATPTGQGGWSFDGSDDYVDAGSAASLNVIGSLSLAAWVKVNVDENGGIIDKAYNSGGYMLWIESLASGFQVYVNGAIQASGSAVSLAIWYHVAVIIDGVANQMYLNGKAGTSNNSNTPTGNTNVVTIGKDVLGRYPNVSIGEAAIYNRALTEHDILNLYNETKGRYGGGA